MPTTTEEIIIDVEAKGANKAEKDLEGVADATNEADEQGQKYEQTLGDMAKETKVFGVSLDSLTGGFKSGLAAMRGSVQGLKAFKIALAATGIGLIVIALGSMVAFLKESQEGMNFLNDSMAIVKSTIDVLLGVLVQLGQAFLNLFSGNFQEAIDAAIGAFDNLGGRIRENADQAERLSKAFRDLGVDISNNTVTIAENNTAIAENKRLLEDTTQATIDRLEASKEAQALIIENGNLQIETAQRALDILREENESTRENNGLKELTNEQQAAENVLLVELELIKRESEEKQIEFQNKTNTLQLQLDTEQLARTEAQTVAIEAQTTAQIKGSNAVTKVVIGNLAEQTKAIKAGTDAQLAIAEELTEGKIGLTEDEGQAAISTLGEVAKAAGKGAAFFHLLSIGEAIDNLQKSIGIATASRPFPFNLPAIAFAIAQAGAALVTIRNNAQPNTPQFAAGGLLNGPGHEKGGILINAEGGEAVMTRGAVSMFKKQLSAMNVAGGGIPFMQDGGIVGGAPSTFVDLEAALQQQRIVLVTSDLADVQQSTVVTEVLTTL